jgi:histidinol-phosphate aminotransferase
MFLSHAGLASAETYVAGLPRSYVAERYHIPIDEIAKLGSAENPFGAAPLAVDAVRRAHDQLSLYPEWTARALREKIAANYAVDPDQVICGAGETEIIPELIRAFTEPGGEVLMFRPAFPMYHLAAEAEGRKPIGIDMGEDFAPNVQPMIDAIHDRTRLIFLTNPHSPSGRWMEETDVRRVCEAAGAERTVVLDEAYVHFSRTNGYLHLVRDYPNLVVLRTFSKVFGLAGLRVGFGVSSPDRIRPLLALKPTWNLGPLQIAGAAAALDDHDHVRRTLDMIDAAREQMKAGMQALSAFRMIEETRANFFLVEITDPALDSTRAFERLLEQGVIVKDGSVSFRGLGKRYLRVDLSLERHMKHFLDALARVEAPVNSLRA